MCIFLVWNFVGGLNDVKAAFWTGFNTQKISFFQEDIVQTEPIAYDGEIWSSKKKSFVSIF